MDGDGSIQVNHRRSTNLQYRLVIKLKYSVANKAMLVGLAEHIGGTIREVHGVLRTDII